MAQNSVAIFEKAAQMLAEADTIQKTKELKDLALTASEWAKRKGMGEAAVQHAKSYAFEAERKMGEMLKQTERAKGARAGGKKDEPRGSYRELRDAQPTLEDLGLTKKESSRAQQLASLPKRTFEDVKLGRKTLTQVRREAQRAKVHEVAPMPKGKYKVFYADPPWKYGDQLTENYGATRFHYPNMSIQELCAMPIEEMATQNAVLFLWVTSPLLEECFPVIKAWGFKYKASFVWDKVKHNMGHYNSVRHEFLLICTRGSCTPEVSKLFDSVQSIERTQHSEKPEQFRKIIDTLYPSGKRIELFARNEVKGWDHHGNQLSG